MHSGFAIVLAWPETLCRKAGAWYDSPMSWLKINRDDHYKVGHSAVVLVSDNSKSCSYYDFGRYHSPDGFGRVRSSYSDSDLELKTSASYSPCGSKIENLHDVLKELNSNPSTHGDGPIVASVTRVNYSLSKEYACSLQTKKFIKYGPFIIDGTNCSRFVRNVIKAGKPSRTKKYLLRFPPMLSPSPLWNVKVVGIGDELLTLRKPQSCVDPTIIKTIPSNSLWLDGVGAGSWFSFIKLDENRDDGGEYIINRYSPYGDIECSGIFRVKENSKIKIALEMSSFEVIYPSNCREVTLKVKTEKVVLSRCCRLN